MKTRPILPLLLAIASSAFAEAASLKGVEGKLVKVLAIGRSEFGSGGTLGKAIQAWGKADGVVYAEVDQGKEFGYGDYISYKPILERKLAAEKFDYVLLSMHNACWTQRKPEDLIAAAADCHESSRSMGRKRCSTCYSKGPKTRQRRSSFPCMKKPLRR